MHELIDTFFGFEADSDTITGLQMATRAFLVFFVALALLRLSGTRTFGSNTAFDIVVKIMLGAVLSRTIAAASPFVPTLLACLVLVVLHRVLAWAAFRNRAVGWLVKGTAEVLYEHGQRREEALRRQSITEADLREALRDNGHLDSFDQVESIRLERNGSLSVVKKPQP